MKFDNRSKISTSCLFNVIGSKCKFKYVFDSFMLIKFDPKQVTVRRMIIRFRSCGLRKSVKY